MLNGALEKNGEEYRAKVKQWEKESSGIIPTSSVISNLMSNLMGVRERVS